ncbi:flagellar basal-body rod modification protein FlgD [Sphingomonas sp. SORGH_AS 950]|uniref:flagellar hook assembly protein FlgD n=1 Tax=Sphingomonas sp. SORGH_AS_0950 TaxID=3041792 RepID=UPI0027880B2D|nr:flagellar hook assembly protein FlgD [Sphingomonas sp. SORGH_AS_0950]MDQ1158065.1 flagellar basal-body rod modification protein FlgD [Sphingomonas sp. SORGH_AS_0950]
MTSTALESTLDSLGIARTGSTGSSSTTTAAKKSTTLGQADFLKLLTAQLKNQDPFSPMDNTQMVAQMAQFSSVAGISEMNTTLTSLANKLTGTTPSAAMNYVGKTVLTQGTTAYGRTSGGLAGQVELDAAASDVTVTIADASGGVLKTLSLGAQKAGAASYDWDGKTADGKSAGSGPFTISVSANNGSTAVTSRSLVWAPVQSVSLPSTGSPVLTVAGLGQVQLSAVRAVG